MSILRTLGPAHSFTTSSQHGSGRVRSARALPPTTTTAPEEREEDFYGFVARQTQQQQAVDDDTASYTPPNLFDKKIPSLCPAFFFGTLKGMVSGHRCFRHQKDLPLSPGKDAPSIQRDKRCDIGNREQISGPHSQCSPVVLFTSLTPSRLSHSVTVLRSKHQLADHIFVCSDHIDLFPLSVISTRRSTTTKSCPPTASPKDRFGNK